MTRDQRETALLEEFSLFASLAVMAVSANPVYVDLTLPDHISELCKL
jgi:hypothetical protein